jgi:hypothetical protein
MSDHDSNTLTSDSEQEHSEASIPWRHTEFALTPCYYLHFSVFKADADSPKFAPHPFWTAMSSKGARPLAKLACICRSTKHKYTEEAMADLKNGLRAFVSAHLLSFPVPVSRPV